MEVSGRDRFCYFHIYKREAWVQLWDASGGDEVSGIVTLAIEVEIGRVEHLYIFDGNVMRERLYMNSFYSLAGMDWDEQITTS